MNPNVNPFHFDQGKIPVYRKDAPFFGNTVVLDQKVGDVTGDHIPDRVCLTGEKGQNPFFENLQVMVQDGRTLQWSIIPLWPKYSIATTPWLFLGSFSNAAVEEIMVNLPVGGSGALTFYYVISFLNSRPNFILGPEDFTAFTATLGFEVDYLDNYKVLVKSNRLNQSYFLDVSSRKESYEGTVYNRFGKLIKPLQGFVIDLPHLYPVKFDGGQPFKLEALQDIAGTSHADSLGSAVTFRKFTGFDRSWVLEPEMFFVLLE